jgi:hypothetical protein
MVASALHGEDRAPDREEKAMAGSLRDALEPVAQQLQADDYVLEYELTEDDVLDCTVVAGPEACEECLVPKELMSMMITDQLRSAGLSISDVHLRYPFDH